MSERRLHWTVTALAALGACSVHGQDLEPRLYTNAPIGLNFLALAYGTSQGGALFDPSVPLENAEIDVDAPAVAYVRSLGLGSQSAKVDVVLPYACLSGSATLAGEIVTRDVCGFADPRFRLSVNFRGGPALRLQEFGDYRQDMVVGGSLQVIAPVGQYDSDRVVNIGTNRWSIKPEIGFSKALQHLTVEMAAAVTFYTDNSEFVNGKKEQDPIYSLQVHVVHVFQTGRWLAADVNYYRGGRSTVDGVTGDDLQENSRFGVTFGFPLNRYQSLRLHASTGVSTRTGTDFDTLAVTWQYRWAAGL
jgi:Putative MetA-pathway of phenol degradation